MKPLFLVAAILAAGVCISPAAAQEGAFRIVPGFEKVHSDLKKKENEQLKEIARADAETDAAESLRLDGERLIADMNAQIESHVIAYRSFSSTMGAATTSREARTEAKGLQDLAKLWAKAEDERARGEKMIRMSEANAARAAERRSKAEARIAELRMAMARTYEAAPAAQRQLSTEPVVGPEDLAPRAVSKDDLPAIADPVPDKSTRPAPKAGDALDSELLGGTDPGEAAGGAAPLKSD